MSNQQIIDAVVAGAAIDLFGAYGNTLTLRETPLAISEHADVAYAAVIGFTGPSMRGTLTLAPSRASATPSGEDPVLARDWVGELSNQLMGRIKNRLLGFSVEIWVTTPAVLRGHQLAAVPSGGDFVPYVFDSERGHVWIYFDAEMKKDLMLERCDAGVPAEGDTILF